MVAHDAVAALPVGSDAVKNLLRDLLVKRMAYALTSAENSNDLVETDPASGAVILVLIQNGRVFSLDPLDTTTAHDGTTCLVTAGGKRYKIDDLVVPYSVIDKDLTAPPSPAASIGDAYLLASPGTGLWTGLGPVVVLTSHGWEEVELGVGRMIYVEDEDAYYHVNSGGNVVAGLGIASLADDSLLPRHFLGDMDLFFPIVQNQTTTVPPSSPAPSAGDAYIVAAAATGAWTGWDGSIARYENGAWKRYIPSEGWRAYDANLNIVVQFDGTNWVSQAGAVVFHDYQYTEDTSSQTDQTGGANYSYSDATPPTTSQDARIDDATLTRAARKVGAKLRFSYTFRIGDGNACSIALFRDSDANALRHYRLGGHSTNDMLNATFLIVSTDVSSHVYRVRIVEEGGAGHPAAVAKRLFQVEEFA